MRRRVQRILICSAAFMFGIASNREIDSSLHFLEPSRPDLFLVQGERLIGSGSEQQRMLGVELLVRAVYWGEQSGQSRIASSACLALADEFNSSKEVRWLWDLALLIDPSRYPEWERFGQSDHKEQQNRLLSDAIDCMYAIRYHQHPLAAQLFSRAEIRTILEEAGAESGISKQDLIRVLSLEIDRGLNDRCRGRLYIADRSSPGDRITCPDHLRGLGLCANDVDLSVLLLVEMRLLQTQVESWDSARTLKLDGALRLPSVLELLNKTGVHPEESFYRNGEWVTTP